LVAAVTASLSLDPTLPLAVRFHADACFGTHGLVEFLHKAVKGFLLPAVVINPHGQQNGILRIQLHLVLVLFGACRAHERQQRSKNAGKYSLSHKTTPPDNDSIFLL
jgi:hypothetical protein